MEFEWNSSAAIVALLVLVIVITSVFTKSLGWDTVPVYMKATLIIGAPLVTYVTADKVLERLG